MRFDGTVNLGHILTIMSILAGGAYAYAGIQVDLAELKIIAEGNSSTLADHEVRLRALERMRN